MTYTTVGDDTVASSFEVDGSEFIGHVSRAETVDSAEEFVETVEERHPDATHNVSAYRVDPNDPVREKYDDDGEPSGSAGKPVLNVLQKEDLRNVVAVVTRYYGGTKLGYGGLVRAYTKAVKDSLEKADTVDEKPRQTAVVEVGYDDLGDVNSVLDSSGFDSDYEAEYAETVTFEVRVPVESTEELYDRLRSATSGRVKIEVRSGSR
ncbi:MAG: YigZ family protein [Halobacteria archaeon]|nr:YigZ family protein [Halobacteria archaeon]